MSADEGPTIVTGGPANHGAPPLPTEPRTTDVAAWRAEIEAKRTRRPASILRDRPATPPGAAAAPRPTTPRPTTPARGGTWDPTEAGRALSARTPLGRTVVEEYAAGASMVALARRHHLAQATVRRILDDAGVEIRQRGGAGKAAAAEQRGEPAPPRAVPFTPEQVARFAARYVIHGEGLGVIAAAEGVDRDRVRAALVAAGVEIRAVGSHRLPDTPSTTTSTPDPTPAPTPPRPVVALDDVGTRRHPGRRPVSAEDTRAWVHAYVEEAATVPGIAAAAGRTPAVVRRTLKDAGVRMRDDRAGRPRPGARAPELRPKLVEDLVAGYQAGATLLDLARRHKVKAARVREALVGAGIEIRPPVAPVPTPATTRPRPSTPSTSTPVVAHFHVREDGAVEQNGDPAGAVEQVDPPGVEAPPFPPAPDDDVVPPLFPPPPPPPGPPTLDEWLFDLALFIDCAQTALARGRALQADLERGAR